MNTNDPKHLSIPYTSIAQAIFGIAVFLLFLFLFIGEALLPDERDILSTNCRPFEPSWEQVLENGERVPIEVPGKVDADYGEIVTLTTTLPQKISYGECLCFRPIWQDIAIYIDGKLRLDYNTKHSRPFGINSPMRYLFVELQETDAGKELSYQFSSHSKYAGNMGISYIGDRLSIWLYLLDDSLTHMLITIFLFIMSFFCIVVCGILKLVYKKTLPLHLLAWTIFFAAFWMFAEITFRQVLIKNISVFSCFAYWSLMLIPIPLLLYMNEIQNNRYQKVYFLPIVYSIAMLHIGTFLQIFDIVQFVQQLPFIHGGLLVSIICIITTITIDAFQTKKQLSEYFFVGLGIYGMLLTAILEMLCYYMGSSRSLGTILAIGLLFLLVTAIIKTGQDLLQTEKKKQQAITARDAQAKFLANMSHEIRTPINAIIGMNEMILRENDSENIKDYAHNIENASHMLLGLINDVLDFSKIESGQLELVETSYHLATLIQDELLLLETRSSGKAIFTQVDIDPTLPSELRGDVLRIKQVLTNLLSNAVKYTDEGSVTLKAFSNHADDNTIMLCFSVIDTGIGIRKEDLSQVFDSFKRLELNKNHTIQGTGLGLNIARQLIDLMQGTIVVDSVYGKGSTFTISIPQEIVNKQPIGSLEDALAQHKKETEAAETPFTAPDASVLIVDDNSMNLSLMKGLLKRSQIQVDLAISGKKCLELTKRKRYDLIFMDHMMPELDGVETLHKLRADSSNPNQNAIIIVLTANAIAGSEEMYLQYGFTDYFTKPVQANKLDALLMQYLPKSLVCKGSPQKSSTDSRAALSKLLNIDYDTGMSHCLNSANFYHEILNEFCLQAKDNIVQLETYFKAEDWQNYAVITHGLKGSALNIGADNFSKLSLQHELAGKEGNAEFIKGEYTNYVIVLKGLIKKIEGMFK